MQNAGLDEAQAQINIAGRNINNLRYADDTTLKVKSKSLLMSPEYSLEGTDSEAEAPILWPPDVKNWLIGKNPDAGKDWKWEEKKTTEDEIIGWHHWLDGHEFEQALGVWWTGKTGVLQSMGSQRVREDWTMEQNWVSNENFILFYFFT